MPYSTRRGFSRPSMTAWYIAGGAVLAVAILITVLTIGAYGKHHSVDTVVQSKERVCGGSNNGHSSCKYLVFTDQGTYRITDAFLIGTTRFNSSDVYGRIRACDKYRIEYYGWRLPYFSSYPNIIKATDLGADKTCRPS